MTNNFSKELDENLNSMSRNLDRCKLDHEHIKSLNNETAKLNHYEAQF